MKNIPITIATVLLFVAQAHAETLPSTSPPPHEMKPGMHSGMMNMTDAQQEQHIQAMQDHLLKMHNLSNQILAEKDPTKKEQLKKEQRDLMKAHHMMKMERHKEMEMMKEPKK